MGDPRRWPGLVILFLVLWGASIAMTISILGHKTAWGLDSSAGPFILIPLFIMGAAGFLPFGAIRSASREVAAWRSLQQTMSSCPICGYRYAEKNWPQRLKEARDHDCSIKATIRDTGQSLQGVLIDKDGEILWSCGHAHSNRQVRRFGGEYRGKWDAEHHARAYVEKARLGLAPVPAGIRPRGPITGLGSHTWERMKRHYNYRCYYCGSTGDLHKEHYIPLSRGGENTADNIVPACRSCNLSKGTMTGDEYMSSRKREGLRVNPEGPTKADGFRQFHEDIKTLSPFIGSESATPPPVVRQNQGGKPESEAVFIPETGVPQCVDGPKGCSPQVVIRADGQYRCGMHEMNRPTTRSAESTETGGFTDLGAGVWKSVSGWELVHVLHDEDEDLFFFRTQRGYTYGKDVGGYGRNELATLYVSKKLSLAPERVVRVAPGEKAAVILNAAGEPVLAHPKWKRGLDPLISDPAFHGDPFG